VQLRIKEKKREQRIQKAQTVEDKGAIYDEDDDAEAEIDLEDEDGSDDEWDLDEDQDDFDGDLYDTKLD